MDLKEKLQQKEKEMTKTGAKEHEIIFWKPNVGDILEGEAIDHGETITEYGSKEYLDVLHNNKTYRVFLTTTLKRQFEDEGIRKGDSIAIKYTGLVVSKNNRKYKNYVMVKG